MSIFRISNIVILSIFVFFFSALTKGFFEYQNSLAYYESQKKQYEQEKKLNNSLKAKYTKYNDPFFIEKTMRENLQLQKDGEFYIIIPSPTASPYPLPTKNQDIFSSFFK